MEHYLSLSFVALFSTLFIVSSAKSLYNQEESAFESVPSAYYTNLWGEKRSAPIMPYQNAYFRPWANIRNSKRISEQEIQSVLKNAWLG
uniref:Uncharacterized protein n=1 Tax=Acrobeloides nanus TaxID=290746 RepID=A0A914EC27_9BILA